MKTIATLLVSILSLTFTYAQTTYEKGMERGLSLTKTDYDAAGAHFERMAAVEKTEWLPAYYAAYYHINNSWGMHDKEKTMQHLEKAQEYLDQASTISKENTEIMVLQALINTAWITYDGSVYGMKLSGPTTAIYKKAIALAPNNPRVVSNHAQWMIGSARYFNKNVAPYCASLDKAIQLFNNEKAMGFNPRWGMDGAVEARAKCK
ncbi:MAG: hypothetical protein WBA16_04755 [Nonlabens sp.]